MTTLIPKYSKVTTSNRTIAEKFNESISVKDFGAVGDGVTDDTAAIQAALNYLTGNQTLLFPGGRYSITAAGGVIDAQGLLLTNVDDITILGYGATLFRADAPTNFNKKPLTVTNCDQFNLIGLSFDNNGSLYFGGTSIYESSNVIVKDCRFYDSAPGAVTSDRGGLIIATSFVDGSNNILVEGNTFDGLQTDFYVSNCRVIGNYFKNCVNRALGIVSGGVGLIRENYTITGNTFENPLDDCISIGIDPSSNTSATIRNINITGNVYKSTVAAGGHFVSINAITASNIVKNIVISNNIMFDSIGNPFIRVNSTNTSQYSEEISITDNVYQSTAAVTGPVIYIRRTQQGRVCNNTVFGTGIVDAFYFSRLGRMTITGNQAEATGKAYELDTTLNSATGYTLYKDNTWMGAPTTILSLPTGLNASDIVETLDPDFTSVTVVGAAQAVNVAGMINVNITAVAAASVTTLTQGYKGMIIRFIFDNANVTINHGTSTNQIALNGAANFVGSANDTLTVMFTGTNWKELSRAVI